MAKACISDKSNDVSRFDTQATKEKYATEEAVATGEDPKR